MKEPFELVHRNLYRLSCRPDPTPEGSFLARVLVSWVSDGGETISHRLRPELPAFAVASEAAAAGRDAAIHWLENPEPAGSAAAPLGSNAEGAPNGGATATEAARDEYLAAHAAWRAAAQAFEELMQRPLSDLPIDPTQAALDASALKRLHEQWLEKSLPLAMLRRP